MSSEFWKFPKSCGLQVHLTKQARSAWHRLQLRPLWSPQLPTAQLGFLLPEPGLRGQLDGLTLEGLQNGLRAPGPVGGLWQGW